MQLEGLRRIGFLTLPGFSMIAAASAIEVLRMANRISGRDAFSWDIVTLDGTTAAASNGLMLAPAVALTAAGRFDLLFVCGGVDVRMAVGRPLLNALRRAARNGVALGALCTGTFALAEAGLLRGYRCAVHWEDLASIVEEFPDIDIVEDLFVIDRDRITCTGGIAPLDLMLRIVGARLGLACADAISTQFITGRGRAGAERQPIPSLPDLMRLPAALRNAIRLIETGGDAISGNAALANEVHVSTRQLERLFRTHTGLSPAAYALGTRLERARRMLRQTALSVTDVGVACGFRASGHFSTAYRSRFGRPPSLDRNVSTA